MTALARWRGAPGPVIVELQELEAAGELTNRSIVDRASDPASALHDHFEWDNDVASDKFRLVQATLLLNRIKIHVTDDEIVTLRPAFVSIRDEEGRRRRVLSDTALSDPEMLAQVLADTRVQIHGLRNRLSGFEEAAAIVMKLDDALREIQNGSN